jgi:hypothetical protein
VLEAETPRSLPGDQCVVHRSHWPPVRETERHHIWPLGMGGPNIAANIVHVCPTGHSNIHLVIRALVAGTTPPKVTRAELRFARSGFQQWLDAQVIPPPSSAPSGAVPFKPDASD